MVLDFKVECVLDMNREAYWNVKASKGFFDFLVEDKCLYKMEASAEWHEPNGATHLKCAYVPRTVEIPDVVRQVLGDTVLEVLDDQSWNREVDPYKIDFVITPTFLTGSIKTKGSVRLLEHPEDPNKTVHIVEGTAEVNLYFVWSFIEDAILQNMKKFYSEYPAHVDKFKEHMSGLVGEKDTDTEAVTAYLNLSDIHNPNSTDTKDDLKVAEADAKKPVEEAANGQGKGEDQNEPTLSAQVEGVHI